jgi:serine protease Do
MEVRIMAWTRFKNIFRLSTIALLVFVLIQIVSAAELRAAQQNPSEPPNLVTAIAMVANEAIPAVVHVEVTQRQEIRNPFLPFENAPFFRHFFQIPKMPKQFERNIFGLGSGVIFDDAGHVLTNYHVVGGAIKIRVALADGRVFSGKSVKIVGTDPQTDLAVIQIQGQGPFAHLSFGNSDKVEVGQWVVAIGQPEGLSETVTQGIISAKHRTGLFSSPTSAQDYLQTDAAINPGNSGGPLMDLSGRVIGINSAIITQSGGFEGLGFAIPSNVAAYVSKELIRQHKVIRGWLGVTLQKITPELAKSFKLSLYRGCLVTGVIKDSPAWRAGIKRGDVITAFESKPVPNPSILADDVSLTPPGTQVTLTITRNASERKISVTLGNLQEQHKALETSLKRQFGLIVKPITPQEANKYGLGSRPGWAIEEIIAGSSFARADFEKGDIILEIDNRQVPDLADLFMMLSTLKSKSRVNIKAVDHRSGQIVNVFVKLS